MGGEASYLFSIGGHQWYANVRGYSKFCSENHVLGFHPFALLNSPIIKL